jgi:hypothetical protein
MRRILLAVSALGVLLIACSDDGLGAGGIDIRVELASGIEEDVQVVSARGERPGSANPVEAVITLRNVGDVARRLRLRGSWHDAGGGLRGGADSVVTLDPGQIREHRAGTRSRDVAAYRFTVEPTRKTQDQLLTETLASGTLAIADGYGMTFTETPSRDAIPPWSPRGVANGAPFSAGTILFRPATASPWRLEISDRRFDALRGAGLARHAHKDLQTIYLDLPREPAAGTVFEKEMSYGGGYFQIKPAPDAATTTSWNTSLAYVVEITRWSKGPSAAGPCGLPARGSASGRFYVSFKGSGLGPERSWVSGTFEDAAIVYCPRQG